MSNRSGNVYGLTTLCPLVYKDNNNNNESPVMELRKLLQRYDERDDSSPMMKVPNTYLARFFVLDDVIFQSCPYQLEHLKSKYLVFTANFYGDLDPYLEGMYTAIPEEIKKIWHDGVGFNVVDAQSFKAYIKKCQVTTTFLFNGSTDDPLATQLKSLYIKQEFSKFVFQNQGTSPDILLQEFKKLMGTIKPSEPLPTWKAGISDLNKVVQY